MMQQLQPNSWSCLPTAFAIGLGCTVDSLIEEIGHDGSEIWYPNKPEPSKRRSFHPQEIVDACLRLHPIRYIVHIDSDPTVHPNDFANIRHIYFTKKEREERLRQYLLNFDSVLTGTTLSMQRHAVAWDHVNHKIIDPRGKQLTLKDFIAEDMFLIIDKL